MSLESKNNQTILCICLLRASLADQHPSWLSCSFFRCIQYAGAGPVVQAFCTVTPSEKSYICPPTLGKCVTLSNVISCLSFWYISLEAQTPKADNFGSLGWSLEHGGWCETTGRERQENENESRWTQQVAGTSLCVGTKKWNLNSITQADFGAPSLQKLKHRGAESYMRKPPR